MSETKSKKMKLSKNPISRSPSLMIAMYSIVILALVGGGFCLKFMHQAGVEPDTVYYPEGYYERVETLLKKGLLVHRKIEGVDRRGNEIPSWGMMVFDEDKAKEVDAKWLDFYEESSRLQEDIADFNEDGPGGLFELKGDQITVNKTVHNFHLPYPVRNFWQGSLAFRGSDFSVLISDGVVMEFGKNEEDEETGAKNTKIMNMGSWIVNPRKAKHRSMNFDLKGAGGTETIARLKSVGDKVVLQVTKSKAHIYLNGLAMNRYAKEDEIDAEIIERNKGYGEAEYELRKGDWLRFSMRDNYKKLHEVVYTFADSADGWISRNWIENGQQVNRIDEEIAEEIPLLETFHHCLSRYMIKHPEKAKEVKPLVKVTLDRELHRVLDSELDKYVVTLNKSPKLRHIPKLEWEGAAVTVMDGLRGDVLALPSYPSKKRLELIEEKALLARKGGLPRRVKERLSQNQNLRPMAIGSTIKPILASAIWSEYPKLRDLKVNEMKLAGQKFRDVLGVPVRNIFAADRGSLDAVSFIQRSSNVYLTELYFLSIARQDSYQIRNGKVVAVGGRNPDFSDVFQGNAIAGGLERDRFKAHSKVYECYDVRRAKNFLRFDSDAFDDHFMGDLFEKLELDPSEGVPREFTPVTPLRPVWELTSFGDINGNLLSWLLGSYNNRWPTVKLAETYSRIGSGKMVKASLVDSTSLSEEKEYADLPIDSEALSLLHRGMEAGVRRPGGTSYNPMRAAIRAAKVPDGVELVFRAKTGTPQITSKTKNYPFTESGVYCLYIECRDKESKEPLAALTIAINLRKRGTSVNAATYAAKVLPVLVEWFNEHPKVKKYGR